MADVHLRPVTIENLDRVLALELLPEQRDWVQPNVKSLAEAYADSRLVPLAIYDAAARGMEEPTQAPMVGFTMYGLLEGIGYIIRLMIDHRYQGQGYGRAAMVETVRRLRLHPEVELIATSHRKVNTAAGKLYESLGFVDWTPTWEGSERERYLRLP